ncbi:hypothetical protein FJT64_018789 [Amphibalanus amphitrite]|uniref:DUF4789 domain-containing protein n=1 Tax=Amphibalanus amphitrite TaxID=1232801 RepID=A0A6A4WVX6_AMPAM|nr:hypothetical protein FJT64_018789 [Amphibalanus amphitrite]
MSPRFLSLSLAVTVALLATVSGRPNSRGILFSGEGTGGTAPRLHRPRWMQPPRRAHGAGRSFYFPGEEVERSSAVPDQPRGGTDQTERSSEQPAAVPDRPIQTFSAVAQPEGKPEPPVVVPNEPEVAPERPDSRPQEPELWTEAGCPAGTWFVQSPLTGEAECRTRCCPAGQTLFDGVCWDTSGGQRGPCAAGQGVLLDQFGEGFCDCLARQVYWPAERRCYPVYSRGPCAAGHHLELEVSAAERRAVCRPSRCAQGEVYWGDEAAGVPQRCYSIEELRTDDPCQPGGQLTVDVHTLEISCVTVTLHAVFDPPQVRCPAGSYLDFTGQCREELVQKFRSSFAVVEQPESRSLCPVGFVAKPDGSKN